MIVRVVKGHPPGVKNQKKIVIFDGDHDKFVNSGKYSLEVLQLCIFSVVIMQDVCDF